MMQKMVTLEKPSSVRWLSLHEAVSALYKCWPALVACLGEDAISNAIARGLSQKVENFKFVAFTSLLLDVLPLFTKLSKVFQEETVDYDKAIIILRFIAMVLYGLLVI